MTYYDYRRIVWQSLPPLSALLAVELATGHVLNSAETLFFAIPFLLILVPVLNGLGGNIGIVLGARLTSGLYTGTVTARLGDPGLRAQIRDALMLYLLTLALLGTFIYAIALLFGPAPPFALEVLLFLVLTSGLMLAGVLILVTVGVALLSFSRGLDPDNFVTPVVTTAGDFLGVSFLLLVVGGIL